MSDERLRELEREAALSDKGGTDLTRELRRIGQAFDACDWCWGHGFRLVCKLVERCEFCSKGEPKRSESKKHIADEKHQFYTGSVWRQTSSQRVAATLDRLPKDATERQARHELRAAYPFGQRKYHPYKIWCDEVRKQLAKRFGVASDAPIFDPKEASRDVR